MEVPQTVERVILARSTGSRPPHTVLLIAASALGRRFDLPLLEGVSGERRGAADGLTSCSASTSCTSAPLASAGVPVQARADSGDRLPDGPHPAAAELHQKAARWLEDHYADNQDEVVRLARPPLARGRRRGQGDRVPHAGRRKARQEYALDEAIEHYRALLPLLEARGERQEIALVLFKLALALHTAMRFAESNETYQRAFENWTPPRDAGRSAGGNAEDGTS